MNRNELIKRMLNCFNECKKMDYSDTQAMDRALEIVEEHLEDVKLREALNKMGAAPILKFGQKMSIDSII